MELAKPILGCEHIVIGHSGTSKCQRLFQESFGAAPKVVATAWKLIALEGKLDFLGPRSLKPIHLLWALMFLKGYSTEGPNSARAKCDEKTFRKWTWFYTKCLAELDSKVVSGR